MRNFGLGSPKLSEPPVGARPFLSRDQRELVMAFVLCLFATVFASAFGVLLFFASLLIELGGNP